MSINPQTHTYSVGRYRVGRSISNFGKKAMALEAFNSLIDLCANKGAWLMLSYADNSIVDIDDLRRITEINYDVRIKKIELNHSKQGRSSTSKVDEYLFLCRPKESLLTIGEKLFEIRELKPIVDNPAGFMHNYMARKPYNTISAIIENFCPENGTVYDPMFGSGTTLIEASKLGRKAIGTDINPIAYKLCKASLTKWDVESVYFLIDSFCAEVKKSCEYLYTFNCNGEERIIERCHFNQIDNTLIPTMYWYKTIKNGKLTGRKKSVVDNEFISWYKSFEGSPIFNVENKPLIPNSRIAISTHYTVFTYFCNRNIIALDSIMDVLKKHTDEYGYEILELIVSSALNLIKLSDKKASSQMPYWLPKINVTSRNATIIIEEKVKVFKEALIYLRDNCKLYSDNELADDKKITVRNVAAQAVSYSDLPNDSIDLVLTDPPYTDQVPYLEYSQLWNKVLSWNGMTEEALQSELVVSDAPSRKKDINDFNFTFSQIVKRTSDAIKIGGYFIMFYHSFNLKSWSHILALMNAHGLNYCYQMPVSTPRKSFKTVMSPNGTLNGHYIVVFQKKDSIKNKVFLGTLEDAKERAINCAREIIESHNNVTTQDLYDGGMLKEAFEEGYLAVLAEKHSSLIDVISNEFDNTDGIWRKK
jgi:DNA modification methylase